IDQGCNVETSTHATTNDDPVYEKHGVLHYTVANVPGAVPRTSTKALTNVTVNYARQIAQNGIKQAASDNETILTGI
ncbi:alanine dehydrogenase, partial [Salmonella enterica subsp. enterica serovar Typhimurium]